MQMKSTEHFKTESSISGFCFVLIYLSVGEKGRLSWGRTCFGRASFFNPFTAKACRAVTWKKANISAKFETIKAFSPFTSACKKISNKMLNIESRFVIGQSNILSTGVYVCTFQKKFDRLWQRRG